MGRVLFETDDPLNEANLGEFIAHQNNRDYIDTHPTVNANWSANELGLGDSRSWIFFDDRLYTVLPDSGTVTLPNGSGENFVFVTFDSETRDSPSYVAVESQGDVSDPKLLIFVADTSTESVDPRNAAPDIDVATLEAVAASVESEPTEATDVARKAETDALDAAKADTPHDLGGADHSEDTLENLNSKVSDATLDDTDEPREPEAHSETHQDGGTDEISVAGLSGELADPQPSQTQDDGVDVVASPTLNFGNGLDVTDDAGTAQVDFDAEEAGVESNTPDWVEDGNSPQTVTNDSELTYTLAGEYDIVKVYLSVDVGEDDPFIPLLQINGDAGDNYDFTRVTGDSESDQDGIRITEDQNRPYSIRTQFNITGRWTGNFGYGFSTPQTNQDRVALVGENDFVDSPLNEIKIVEAIDRETSEIKIEVFGRDIA